MVAEIDSINFIKKKLIKTTGNHQVIVNVKWLEQIQPVLWSPANCTRSLVNIISLLCSATVIHEVNSPFSHKRGSFYYYFNWFLECNYVYYVRDALQKFCDHRKWQNAVIKMRK